MKGMSKKKTAHGKRLIPNLARISEKMNHNMRHFYVGDMLRNVFGGVAGVSPQRG